MSDPTSRKCGTVRIIQGSAVPGIIERPLGARFEYGNLAQSM
jgi:hypothetical protein